MSATHINSRFNSTSAVTSTRGVPLGIAAQTTGSSIQSGNNHARRTHDVQKSPRRSLRYAPDDDLAAKIGMPAVLNFQLLPDMGRMNG